MIEEVIDNIIQAEKRADEMVKQAQSQSKEMIANAKDVSIAMLEDEKKRTKNDVDAIVNKAILSSEEKSRKDLEKCEEQAKELESIAKKNQDKAVDFIIRSINTKYDMWYEEIIAVWQ